ncbi:hypothetical protein ACXIUT_19760 [Achromobacter denitrificans]
MPTDPMLILPLVASALLAFACGLMAFCFLINSINGQALWPRTLGFGVASALFVVIFISQVARVENSPASQDYILKVAKSLQDLPEERLLAESLLKPGGPTYNDLMIITKEKYRRIQREEAEFKSTRIESLREAARDRLKNGEIDLSTPVEN